MAGSWAMNELSNAATYAWLKVCITEEGGFAGISRSARVIAADLSEPMQKQWGQWLSQLQQTSVPIPSQGADYQIVRLHCESSDGHWEACFNNADLPKAVANILSQVTLRP